MEQIDITTEVTFWQTVKAQFGLLLIGWPKKLLSFAFLAVLLPALLLSADKAAHVFAWIVITLLAALWTFTIARLLIASIKYYRTAEARQSNNSSFRRYINEQGLGVEDNNCEVFLRWSAFKKVFESRSIIYLVMKEPKTNLLVFKKTLSQNDLASVDEMLKNSGTRRVKMSGKRLQ